MHCLEATHRLTCFHAIFGDTQFSKMRCLNKDNAQNECHMGIRKKKNQSGKNLNTHTIYSIWVYSIIHSKIKNLYMHYRRIKDEQWQTYSFSFIQTMSHSETKNLFADINK